MSRPSLSRLRYTLAPLVMGLACAAWMLYPAYLDGEHVLVGDWRHPDMLSNHWLYCWVAEQLAAGRSILHNFRYYYPVGDAPWLAGNGGDAVPYTLFHALGGWPGGLTAWLFLAIVLNVLAGYALCRRVGAERSASLFGAATLGVFSYIAHELSGGRFSQVPIYGLLAFLWAWMGLLERPGWRRALLAGLLFGWTADIYWYYGLWAAWMGFILGLAWFIARRGQWRGALGPLALFVGVSLACTLPLLRIFLDNWSGIPGSDDLRFPHPLALSSSLSVTFPLYGGSMERGEVLLSATACLLALVGLWRMRGWKPWGLVASGVFFYLLALGPEIHGPRGVSTGIPGLFAWVYRPVGVLQRYWWPYRHILGVAVPVAALAALGLGRLQRWLPRPVALVLPWLLAALLPLELEVRGGKASPAMSWWEPPQVYEQLAALDGEAILELPVAPQVVTTQQSLIYQRVHGKALVNGHAMWVDRVRPDAWDTWVEKNTFLTVLQRYERGQLFGPFAFQPQDVAVLREQGITYLVLNAEYFPQALYGLVERYPVIFQELFGAPVLQWRDHLFVWDLRRYTLTGSVAAPEFQLPASYLDRDGSHMLDVGHNRALGLRGLTRVFPPQLPPGPPAGESGAGAPPDGQPLGGPHPDGQPLPGQEGPGAPPPWMGAVSGPDSGLGAERAPGAGPGPTPPLPPGSSPSGGGLHTPRPDQTPAFPPLRGAPAQPAEPAPLPEEQRSQ